MKAINNWCTATIGEWCCFMKIQSSLHFTENHRFCMFRDFSIGPLQETVLSRMYQPMTGALAVALYRVLHQQLPADRVGCSALETQRILFLSLGVELGEKGRKQLIEAASLLEAVGLMQSFRVYVPAQDEYIYRYHLNPPLTPYEFFRNEHLSLLLRDCIGKHALLALYKELCAPMPAEAEAADPAHSEDVSTAFYEWFTLRPQGVDEELAELQSLSMRIGDSRREPRVEDGFQFGDIIVQFPRTSRNRPFVERLQNKPHRMTEINFVAKKYRLTLPEVCRLLDEDDLFAEDGELQYDVLQSRANLLYRQRLRREEARELALGRAGAGPGRGVREPRAVERAFFLEVPDGLREQFSVEAYNDFLCNHSHIEVLELFFPGAVPNAVLDTFERLDLHYRLNEEVINVLIHYLKTAQLPWNGKYIETIAADMLGQQIDTYEKAVDYVRRQMEAKRKKTSARSAAESSRSRRGVQGGKPQLPLYPEDGASATVSDQDVERIIRKAQRLKKT